LEETNFIACIFSFDLILLEFSVLDKEVVVLPELLALLLILEINSWHFSGDFFLCSPPKDSSNF